MKCLGWHENANCQYEVSKENNNSTNTLETKGPDASKPGGDLKEAKIPNEANT